MSEFPCACGHQYPSYEASAACERTCDSEDRATRSIFSHKRIRDMRPDPDNFPDAA